MERIKARKKLRATMPSEIKTVGKDGSFYIQEGELKTEIPTEPNVPIDYGYNEVYKTISCGMYWDSDLMKWRKIESAQIATAQCKAKYYSVEPADLTETDWNELRIDYNRALIVNNRPIPPTITETDTNSGGGAIWLILQFGPANIPEGHFISGYDLAIYSQDGLITGTIDSTYYYGDNMFPAVTTGVHTLASVVSQRFTGNCILHALSLELQGTATAGKITTIMGTVSIT